MKQTKTQGRLNLYLCMCPYRVQCNFSILTIKRESHIHIVPIALLTWNLALSWETFERCVEAILQNEGKLKKKKKAKPNSSLNITSACRIHKNMFKISEETLIFKHSFKKKCVTSFVLWVTTTQCSVHCAHYFSQKTPQDVERRG